MLDYVARYKFLYVCISVCVIVCVNRAPAAMVSHPPVPISELAEHIERLKANSGARYSAEYESIDPGQQLTWDAASQDDNKPKNRYANVIAYDHSRVQLYSLGEPTYCLTRYKP